MRNKKRNLPLLGREKKKSYLCAQKYEKKMTTLLSPTLIIIAVAMLLLGVRFLFNTEKGFPSSHVDDQPALKEKGLTCHRSMTREALSHRTLAERISEQA